jgi:uncharacterized protein (TIGR00299 family) protein
MRLLVFDPFRGAAGDMITAALLHLGADRDAVVTAMASVVGEPEIIPVDRSGIRALSLKTRARPVQRTFNEVINRVNGASAPEEAIVMAMRVFERIEQAEREIHGESAHFHEVGADDAVADVVGACTAFGSLAPDGCIVLPVSLGGGLISGSHGTYPVPAPATLAILRESGLVVSLGTATDGELCTPTGAALLSEFSTFPGLPDLRYSVLAVGYGAGSRNPQDIPNVLRAMIVECSDPGETDTVDILETNVDDVSAEVIAYTFSRLLDEGAYDVSAFPCTMKKGRPGHLIRVVAPEGDGERLASVMVTELGTLGIRCIQAVHRFAAERSVREVPVTIQGRERMVHVKCGLLRGKIFSLKAEYDDTSAIARETGLPVRTIARMAESIAWKLVRKSD